MATKIFPHFKDVLDINLKEHKVICRSNQVGDWSVESLVDIWYFNPVKFESYLFNLRKWLNGQKKILLSEFLDDKGLPDFQNLEKLEKIRDIN